MAMAEYQVKVEYSGNTQHNDQKWIIFMVNATEISAGRYNFRSLVNDITTKCPSLNFLDVHTIRPRYLDDEDNWITLNYDDERGYCDLWQSAKEVPQKDFRRIKLKAGILGSPLQTNCNFPQSTQNNFRLAMVDKQAK